MSLLWLRVTGSKPALRFVHEPVPEGFGWDDYEPAEGDAYRLHAYSGDRPVGYAEYEHIPDERRVNIRWIEATEGRRGVGSALVHEIARRHPDHNLETGGFTPEGEALNAHLDGLIHHRREW